MGATYAVRRVGSGAWLGAVRTRLQTMCRNGESVTWGSDDKATSECTDHFEEKPNMSKRPVLSTLSPSSTRKTGWPASFVTNFQRFDEPLYRKLLEMFPDKGLRIEDPAYDVYGREAPSMLALHRAGGEDDMSDFWQAYERLLVQEID